MSLRTSLYVNIAEKKAREDFFKNPQKVTNIVTQAIAQFNEREIKLNKVYNFFPDHHKQFNNEHIAAKSKGCGCKLCLTRHLYTKAKNHLHWIEQEYYADDINIFHEIYLGGRESELQTEEEYFEGLRRDCYKEIKNLKQRYESIKDTINSLLEK